MQGLCHLSRRWHQQFCRSPSFSLSHQPCLRQFYHPSPSSLARQRAGPRPPPLPRKATAIRQGGLVVREYEQDDEKSLKTRRAVDHNQDPFIQEAQSLKAQMQSLDEEIDLLKEGPFGPNSDFMQSLPEEHRVRLLEELKAQGLKSTALRDIDLNSGPSFDFNSKDIDLEDEQHLSVSMRVADKHRAWVGEFNKALHSAQDKSDDPLPHRLLWKCYLRCHQKVPGFCSFVNEDVWHFLWKSQVMTYPGTDHIIMLAKDMKVADIDLSHAQRLDYIDALHAAKDTASAISEWENEKVTISNKSGEQNAYKAVATLEDDLAARFWATGVELFAAVGRPAKAQEIAFKSLETNAGTARDSESLFILVEVIRAWAHSQRTDADVKLWSCYMLMREKSMELSDSKTLPTEVLGQITSELLKTGHQRMALAVFQDMLSAHTGNITASNANFERQISKSLSIADGSVANETIINQVGLTALLALPSRLKNKFFFGSWIKWLIGQDKVDDAALVVELMQELGVKPDARHLNGIIGAWLRSRSPHARTRAEQMAWAMIHARIDLVKAQSPHLPAFQPMLTTSSTSLTTADDDHSTPYATRTHLPTFLQRNIPPATIETFSVLLLRYTRAADIAKSTQLTDILTGPCDMHPNSFILNHWLNLSLRSSDLNAMYARYLSTKADIASDLETFAILWDGCRRNLDRARAARSERYWDPRQLFAEMRGWYTSLSPEKKGVVRQDFLSLSETPEMEPGVDDGDEEEEEEEGVQQLPETENALYTQIIRSFCLHSDLRGTYAALEYLYSDFTLLPNEDIAMMILMQVARMAPMSPNGLSGGGGGGGGGAGGMGIGGNGVPSSKPRRAAIKRGARDQLYRGALGRMALVLQGVMDYKMAKMDMAADALAGERGDELGSGELLESGVRAVRGGDMRGKVRLDAIKSFIVLVLLRMKESKGQATTTVLEEIRVAGVAMGVSVDLDEVRGRVLEVRGFEGDSEGEG